jgi:hypothetical protein
MLSPGIVVVLLVGVTAAAVWAGFSRRSLFVSAGVLEVLGLVLLGLPGAAFLETLQPVMERAGRGSISADGAWPAAIVMSVAWPAALFPAYFAARSLGLDQLARGGAALTVLALVSALIGVLVYGIAT